MTPLPAVASPRDQRNRVIVERFAAGETYTPLARAFRLTVHGVVMIIHRYIYLADSAQYWDLLRAHGHRLTLPQEQLRVQVQALLGREGS